MGVPKFFRYTSERYPCLNELVKQYQIPEFDNMYLDMNGIIHNCSHPDDSNPHFRITEEKIFQDIFHYLSILFQIIKPKKLFFMAIDGVAPRAKMNQQRGRRFRAAREAEKLEEDAKAKGEELPKEKRFDSNCITPGTVFMARLHEQLKYFIKHKMSTDPQWSKVKVILSGHETPGEGEHKIMDYIRWARSQPDYDPNIRHCLYGLDADLIMLGMCTHEPHFALLREEVKFGKTTQRATCPEETNFYLLHLALLKEYLEQEFISLKGSLSFKYDVEKIVDDWVLMGFLVGNDFIPNLPNMHINNDALPILYKTYMAVLPTLDGYINESGVLNLKRFEMFMQELAKLDKEMFQDTYADLKYFEAKTGRRPNANERKEYKPNNDDTFNVDINSIKNETTDFELQALIKATEDMLIEDLDADGEDEEVFDTSDEEANFNLEFKTHKKDYYMNKLDYSQVTPEVLSSQAEGYVRAIQWNLHYYYHGCPSWCWYYPHHYAPYISDIKDFADKQIKFELGEPFKPFEQLLAVLPAASKHLLPAPFHELMTCEKSPIVHYYPINFETDLNGKKNDWEAVVLIPFIDEINLLSAMSPCYQRLTDEERKRNTPGPMLVYNWSPENQGVVLAPEYFTSIQDCHAVEKQVFREELDVPLDQLKKGLLPNADKDLLYPGFPTMRHLKYTTEIRKCKVKVFDQPSRNENMIVQIVREDVDPPLEEVAKKLLGKIIWVGWPHLAKAKVMSVSNDKQRLHLIDTGTDEVTDPEYTTEVNAGTLHKQWIYERSTIIEHNMNRLGIQLGEVKTIIHAVSLQGYKHLIMDETSLALSPVWCGVSCGYALQATVTGSQVTARAHTARYRTAQEAYPQGGTVFLLTMGHYYGAVATVLDSSSIRSGRIKVSVCEMEEPTPPPPGAAAAPPYMTANHAAAVSGISSQLLSRVTGCVFVVPGERHDMPTEQLNKINIGLNLKFNKKNQEVSGYTRRCVMSGAWLYSRRCVELVSSYVTRYPELFDQLAAVLNRDVFFEQDLWPNDIGGNKPKDVQAWLKDQPHNSALRRECGSEALEPEEMKQLADALQHQVRHATDTQKKVALHVKWSLLYKPELHEGNISPDPKADFKMYDRVICVSNSMTVPLGFKGTITAIYRSSVTNTVRLSDKMNADASYQVMFDHGFPGGMKEDLFDEPRFYRMQPSNMLNISYGRRLRSTISVTPSEDSFLGNITQTPHLLRRNDGHHSAFASYSPTKDRQTPVVEQRTITTPKLTSDSEVQDNSTVLLKSLLKISQDDPNTNKKPNKQPPVPESSQNWRSRNENQPPPPTPPQRHQQANWRSENSAAVQNNNRIHTNNPNRSFKGQPPVPPYPTFGQPPPSGPGPTQIPFPQFQNPHFQQRNHDNYNRNQNNPHGKQGATFGNQNPPFGNQNIPFGSQNVPFGVQNAPFGGPNVPFGGPNVPFGGPNAAFSSFNKNFAQNGSFPKHLPSINSNTTLAPPSWNKNQGQPPAPNPEQTNSRQHTNSSSDKTSNPFVPLQVQASQRRVQNPSSSTPKKDPTSAEVHAPKPLHTVLSQNAAQQKSRNDPSQKPQRKKKPRIAANLPFHTD